MIDFSDCHTTNGLDAFIALCKMMAQDKDLIAAAEHDPDLPKPIWGSPESAPYIHDVWFEHFGAHNVKGGATALSDMAAVKKMELAGFPMFQHDGAWFIDLGEFLIC